MNPAAHLPALLTRIVYLGKLRAAALQFYARVEDPKVRVRAGVVAVMVAREIDVDNSPAFRADLDHALRGAGWRSVRVDNVKLWKGVARQ